MAPRQSANCGLSDEYIKLELRRAIGQRGLITWFVEVADLRKEQLAPDENFRL